MATTDQIAWEWIERGFGHLAHRYNVVRSELLDRNRLRFSFSDPKLDCIDHRSADLVSAALTRKRPLCIILPDARERRPAFLFAYALLCHWWSSRERSSGTVLYCGVETGVRNQLSRVSITGPTIRLGDVFEQVDLARGSAPASRSENPASGLPRVVTAYSPAAPALLLDAVKPNLIAIDCSDVADLPWLEDLLSEAAKREIPVLCWGTNPLSRIVPRFRQFGSVITWPSGRAFSGCADFPTEEAAEVLFQPYIVTRVAPRVVGGAQFDEYFAELGSALTELRRSSKRARSKFAQYAVQQHWRAYSEIQSLHIPLEIYEAEASQHWGMASFEKQGSTCKHFLDRLRGSDTELADSLEKALSHISNAIEAVRGNDPPLWSGLVSLLETDRGEPRKLVFLSRRSKELASMSLLAKRNLGPSDLAGSIEMMSLAEFQDKAGAWEQQETAVIPTLISLPSAAQNAKLWPIFMAEDANLLLHAQQYSLLATSERFWSQRLSADMGALTQAIADLLPIAKLEAAPTLNARVFVAPASGISTEAQKVGGERERETPLWEASDLEVELSWLVEAQEEGEAWSADDLGREANTPSVENAVTLRFSGGWSGCFCEDDLMTFIDLTSGKTHERYVRSLRAGDTVLIIPSQRRQSLYSLVVARVHRNPAIALHLMVLKRWQEELRLGFQKWKRHADKSQDPPLENLLAEMRQLGSAITSTLAIHFWITGATLCPSDAGDIKRIGQILGVDFILTQHSRIAAAAARIRGLHRGLSVRLKHWLKDRTRKSFDSHDREIVDADTGLTFGDIRSSFVVTQISSVEIECGIFPREALGTITCGALT